MIAAISPSATTYEDTHNTLKYANRAKNIKTKVTLFWCLLISKVVRNVVNVKYHISKYTDIIRELRNEVAELKSKLNQKNAPPPKVTESASSVDDKRYITRLESNMLMLREIIREQYRVLSGIL